MPRQPIYQRPSTAAVGVVLLLHAVLLMGALQLGAWRDRQPAAAVPPPLVVQLLFPRPSAASPPVIDPSLSPPRPALPRVVPQRVVPEAITLPGPTAAPPSDAPRMPEAPPPVSTPASAPAPLDLRLPRGTSAPWRARSPALDDPRSNSARATFESRLAAAVGGDGQWAEERLDADHVRFRRGDTCVRVQRSRGDGLDPYNRSASSRPWIAAAPEKC